MEAISDGVAESNGVGKRVGNNGVRDSSMTLNVINDGDVGI
jgi:hypothetical protein